MASGIFLVDAIMAFTKIRVSACSIADLIEDVNESMFLPILVFNAE